MRRRIQALGPHERRQLLEREPGRVRAADVPRPPEEAEQEASVRAVRERHEVVQALGRVRGESAVQDVPRQVELPQQPHVGQRPLFQPRQLLVHAHVLGQDQQQHHVLPVNHQRLLGVPGARTLERVPPFQLYQ